MERSESELSQLDDTRRRYYEALDLATDRNLPEHVRHRWRKRQRTLGQQLGRLKRELEKETAE